LRLPPPPLVFLCKRENIYIYIYIHLFQDTSLPHLVSFFPAPLIPALLVGKGVTTQALSSANNNNTSNKRNPRIQSQEKSAAFDIKWQKVNFLELNW
jgi:hypothetical protein